MIDRGRRAARATQEKARRVVRRATRVEVRTRQECGEHEKRVTLLAIQRQ